MFVPGQSIPFHFGAGLEHVRKRTLFPSPHVTLHGCHDNHWLQLPFTDEKKKTFHDMKALEKVSNAYALRFRFKIAMHGITVQKRLHN